MRRVFLTGASGFVGRAVMLELRARGHAVRALRHVSDVPEGADEVVSGSLECAAELRPLLTGVDALVHCAALLDPIEDEAQAERINHRATRELAEQALDAGVETFV